MRPKRIRRPKTKEGGVTKEVETEFRLLQIARFPLDLDGEIKKLAIDDRVRYTDYIVTVLRKHVETTRRKDRR